MVFFLPGIIESTQFVHGGIANLEEKWLPVSCDASPGSLKIVPACALLNECPNSYQYGDFANGFHFHVLSGTGQPVADPGKDLNARQWYESVSRYGWYGIFVVVMNTFVMLLLLIMGMHYQRKHNLRIAHVNKKLNNELVKRKQTEEALSESEGKYRTLIETSRDLIYVTDNRGFLSYANPALERILGYEKSELSGRPFTQIVAPESIDAVRGYFKKAMKGKNIPVYEMELVRKNGDRIFVEFNATTLFDSDGNPSGRYGIGRDITEWTKTDRERREYESRLASIINFLPDATLAVDKEGKVIAWNRAIEEMTGVTASEMLGKGSHEYAVPFHGEKRPILIDFAFSWNAEMEMEMEDGFIHREGDTLYAETSVPFVRGETRILLEKAGPLYDTGGNVIGAIESIRDMTDRKRSEDALRLSEERYRTILEEMEDGYHEVDLSGNFTFFNESFRRIFGYSREELLGSNFRRYIADEAVADRIYEAYNNIFRTGNPIKHFEWDVLTKGGIKRTVEFSASLMRDSEGHRRGFRVVARDVTDRNVWEDQYQIMAKSSPGGTYIVQDGRICFINPRVPAYTGYSYEELLGSRILSYVHPEDRESVKDNARRMLRGELTSPYEFRIVDKRGETRWVVESVVSISYRGRKAVLVNNMDITEQRKAEEDKARLQERLVKAQKMEAIGTLAGGIAHDFNNILTGILGHASLMSMGMERSHPDRERLNGIEELVQSGANLTRQLLAFARGGRYELKATNLNEVLEKTSAMFNRTKKEISLHRKFEEGLWAVDADRGQIEQVLMNLFVNAWQAMPGGGSLYLETQNVFLDDKYVQPYDLSSGRYVKIAITDTGVGMDETTKQRIFEPFFTTKEMGRGSGLGLSIVYGIVRGHKGIINVYSEKGHGTTFNLYLPACQEEALREADASKKLHYGKETILVVDDEETIIDVTRELLESLGYHVLTAGSGPEALDVFQSQADGIELVILDMIMPGMGGAETFEELKKLRPNARVILSSGYSLNGQATGIMARGCQAFLQKPFLIADLSRLVRDVLDRKLMKS